MWSKKLQIFQQMYWKDTEEYHSYSFLESMYYQDYKIGAASQTNKQFFRFQKK
jgi:hypothetical protein